MFSRLDTTTNYQYFLKLSGSVWNHFKNQSSGALALLEPQLTELLESDSSIILHCSQSKVEQDWVQWVVGSMEPSDFEGKWGPQMMIITYVAI